MVKTPLKVIQYIVLLVALIHSPFAELCFLNEESRSLFIFIGVAGLVLDLFYSGEFFIRAVKSGQHRGFKFYFYNNYGWVDFLNSLVMLLFVSIPYMVIVFYGSSDLPMGKAFFILYSLSASIRIVRILKFAVVIVPETRGMALRHTWIISCCAVAGIFIVALVVAISGLRSVSSGLSLYFSALVVVFIIRTFYLRYFELNISHVIGVVDSGMRKKNYNRIAVIDERHRDDEVFRLADYYNRFFLPAKMKQTIDAKSLRPFPGVSDKNKKE